MTIDTSEVIAPDANRIGVNAGGPNPGDVIVTDNLWKTYEMGDQVAWISEFATMNMSRSWDRRVRVSRR
jgi:hypothetical protein